MQNFIKNYVVPSVEVITLEMGSLIAQSVMSVESGSISLSGYASDEEALF